MNQRNDDDISNKLDDIQGLLSAREQEKNHKEPDVFATLLTKVLEAKDVQESKPSDLPAYLQILIAVLVLLMSIGGSWVGVKVQTATMQQEIKQLQSTADEDKGVHKEVDQLKWEVKSIKRDVNELKKKR